MIENDRRNAPAPLLPELTIHEPQKKWIERMREAGLIGMGGAGFPTYKTVSYTHLDVYKRQELAELFGSTQSAISNYESGTREPDISLLMRFAEYFDVTVDYLVGSTDLPFRIDSGKIFYTELEKEILLLCRRCV